MTTREQIKEKQVFEYPLNNKKKNGLSGQNWSAEERKDLEGKYFKNISNGGECYARILQIDDSAWNLVTDGQLIKKVKWSELKKGHLTLHMSGNNNNADTFLKKEEISSKWRSMMNETLAYNEKRRNPEPQKAPKTEAWEHSSNAQYLAMLERAVQRDGRKIYKVELDGKVRDVFIYRHAWELKRKKKESAYELI